MGVVEDTSDLADTVTPTNQAVNVDWPQLVFSEDWLKRVDKMAAKRFGEGGLAEEAATYVIDQISFNDWEKCKTFKGQSNPKTYLYTLASNFIEEFSRKRFGRPRPPTWLQRQGQLWIDLWRKLCMERQDTKGLIERLCSDGLRQVEELKQTIKIIKARIPTCGQAVMEVGEMAPTTDEDDEQRDIEDTSLASYDHIGFEFEVGAYGEVILMLKALMNDTEPKETDFEQPALLEAADIADHQQDKLMLLREHIKLTDDERLIMRMIYQDGLSRTAASNALGMASHQAGRIINSAMARIAKGFKACDIELDTLLSMT